MHWLFGLVLEWLVVLLLFESADHCFSPSSYVYYLHVCPLRNGSIVVDGNLHFNNSASKPTETNLTQILHNGTFSFTILTNFTRITDVTPTAGQCVYRFIILE